MRHPHIQGRPGLRSLGRATLSVTFLLLVISILGAGTPDRAGDPGFATSWVLVRLHETLAIRTPAGSLATVTGRQDLDTMIAEIGVHRIDHAFANAMRERRNPQALRRHGLDRTYRFHVAEGTDIKTVVKKLSGLPSVEYAEPDFIAYPGEDPVIPNDPRFGDQWALHQLSDCDVDAPEAWMTTVGEPVLVAVVDSGVFRYHPDLDGKWEWDLGWDFVDNDPDPSAEAGGTVSSHGTHVASIIAAETDNGEGIAGVCWNCRIVPLRVWDRDGAGGTFSVLADAFVWATDVGARVINFSGGGQNHGDTLLSGVNYAFDEGVVFVTITGNDGAPRLRYPGEYLETIAVGSTDVNDHRWPTSNYGPRNDVVAPGVNILGAYMDDGYEYMTGTSFAAPHVSGLAGLLASLDSSVGREEARHLVRAGADDEVGPPEDDLPGFDEMYGWGRINLDRSVLGGSSSMSLRVSGRVATRVYLETPDTLAASYDFVRGDLGALSESWRGVDLGTVTCLENDSTDPDTAGNEDLGTPASGEGFFYLARFNAAPGAGSYGGSSRNRDRLVLPAANHAWSTEGDHSGAKYGWAVSSAGDVNDDGFEDVIVGGPLFDGQYVDEGRAYLYLGGLEGLGTTPAWTADGEQAGALFGTTVATAGDVNDDGHDDVIIGATHYDNGQIDEGRAYVYLGYEGGLQETPVWTAEGDQYDARFGYRVSSAGDVNGDGHDDVFVGTLYYDDAQLNDGKAWVYYGTDTGVSQTPAWTVEGDQLGAWLGWSGGSAGDVNGDTYGDIVVGAPGYDNPETNEGRLLVFHGSRDGLSPTASTTIEIDVANARLGAWFAGRAGDVNCDGFDDVVATAYHWSNSEFEEQEGAAFVFLGSSTGLEVSPAWTFESNLRGTQIALAGAAGRLNDDACDDLIVGGRLHDDVRTDDGVVWVFFGSPTGPSPTPDWSVAGDQPVARFGMVSPTAGDVNGDGYDDLVIGAAEYDNGEVSEGRAYVYLGSPSGPPAVASGDCDATWP